MAVSLPGPYVAAVEPEPGQPHPFVLRVARANERRQRLPDRARQRLRGELLKEGPLPGQEVFEVTG